MILPRKLIFFLKSNHMPRGIFDFRTDQFSN